MDKEQEELIVKAFFEKTIQNRVMFELSSEKKRKDAIGRVDSITRNGIQEKYKIEIQKPNSDYKEILNLLKRYGAGDKCYVISFCEDIDGENLPLSFALEKAVGLGMPSIISCIPGKLAYLECEQSYGAPPRYVLKRD